MTPTTPVIVTQCSQHQADALATKLFCFPFTLTPVLGSFQILSVQWFLVGFIDTDHLVCSSTQPIQGTQHSWFPLSWCLQSNGELFPCCSAQLPLCFFHWCFLVPPLSHLPTTEVTARLVSDLSRVSRAPLCSHRPLDLYWPFHFKVHWVAS